MLVNFVFFVFAINLNFQNTFCSINPTAEESDYRELLAFDEIIASHLTYIREQKEKELSQSLNHSDAVNCANVALMYHERDKRWKQGGTVEALRYINLALNFSSNSKDSLHENRYLKDSLTLYKGLLLTELGYKHDAISIFASLLSASNTTQSVYVGSVNMLEKRDISAIMYHKAEVYLTLFHDGASAVALLSQAIDMYPCNYNAYLKLVMALKDSNLLEQSDWLDWIVRLENTLFSIQQISLTSIVFVDLANKTDSDHSVVCSFETNDLSTSISSLNNVVHINLIRGTLYHALYIAADAAGEPRLAWKFLQQGRHMDRYMADKVSRFSLARSIQQANHVINYFQPGYWPPAHLATKTNMMGSSTRVPVFVVGFFRSGSTLLETMLDAHPAVWGLGENSPFGFEMYAMQDHMREAIKDIGGDKSQSGQSVGLDGQLGGSSSPSREGLGHLQHLSDEEISDAFSSPYAGIVKEHANKVLRKMRDAYEEHSLRAREIAAAGRAAVGHSESESVVEADEKVTRVVDKMLANYYNIGVIHLMFPHAVILHTVRDPMDTLFSCYRNRFADPGTTYTLNFRSLVRQYTLYLEIVAHFRKVLPFAQLSKSASANAKLSGHRQQALVNVRYEELVANPEGVMRRVLSLLGVSWDERVLHFTERNRTVHTASVLQVKRSIYRSSVGQWRQYAAQLNETLVPELRAQLDELVAKGVAMPFNQAGAPDTMNWELWDSFDYSAMMEALKKS